jgi:putative phosphoesterase
MNIVSNHESKIGIISDTHDQIDRIKKAIALFRKEKVELVYYLGDICSPFSLVYFKELSCSVKAVFGNNDGDLNKLTNFKPSNMEFFDRFYVDEYNGKKIALFHGDPKEWVDTLFESKRYDLLLCGHSHVAEIKKNEKTLMINPGSLLGQIENHKDWTKPSVAIYNFEKDKAEIRRI